MQLNTVLANLTLYYNGVYCTLPQNLHLGSVVTLPQKPGWHWLPVQICALVVDNNICIVNQWFVHTSIKKKKLLSIAMF